MHLQNGYEPKHKKIKTFPHKMIRKMKRNSINFFIGYRILITQHLFLLAEFKFRNSVVKFLLVWLNQLTGMHPPLRKKLIGWELSGWKNFLDKFEYMYVESLGQISCRHQKLKTIQTFVEKNIPG